MKLSPRKLSGMKWRTFLLTVCIAALFYFNSGAKNKDDKAEFKGRKLLQHFFSDDLVKDGFSKNSWVSRAVAEEDRCSKKQCDVPRSNDSMLPTPVFDNDQMKHGAVILHCIGILYMFLALALVCDNYFVPSLDVVIEKFNISPDVAGATFMAAGGSAPELFTSVIGVFIVVSDVGIGTIVGSAVFNVLFVIAACAFASKEALSLTAYPLVRDTIFYSIALGILVGFFYDEKIKFYEALILFLWYIVYVVYMYFNSFFENQFHKWFPSLKKNESFPAGFKGNRKKLLQQMEDHVSTKTEKDGDLEMDLVKETGLRQLRTMLSVENDNKNKQLEEDEIKNKYVQPVDKNENSNEDDYENPVTSGLKGGIINKILCVLSMPLTICMFLTIPDPNNKKMKKFFPLAFLGSLVWIIVFSYLMVWWATEVCIFTGMSDATMGITFLAAGTSVPDLITSVLVAKAGHGDMAVSSSIGSNLFDVTVGLPVPWLIYTAIHWKEDMVVSSAGMACNIGMLFFMLIAVFVAILSFKWKMTKAMGVLMMALYVCFLSVALGLSQCWFFCDVKCF